MFAPYMHKIFIRHLEESHYEPSKGLSESDMLLSTHRGKPRWTGWTRSFEGGLGAQQTAAGKRIKGPVSLRLCSHNCTCLFLKADITKGHRADEKAEIAPQVWSQKEKAKVLAMLVFSKGHWRVPAPPFSWSPC